MNGKSMGMTFLEMIVGAAMAVAGAACMVVLFVRDTAQESTPTPVRVRPAAGHGLRRGAVYMSRTRRGKPRPHNR